MQARQFLLLAFFAYILLDLGSPFVPGAFTFDPADSPDAASAIRARSTVAPRIAPPPFAVAAARPAIEMPSRTTERRAPFASVGWQAHIGYEPPRAADPRPAAEDD